VVAGSGVMPCPSMAGEVLIIRKCRAQEQFGHQAGFPRGCVHARPTATCSRSRFWSRGGGIRVSNVGGLGAESIASQLEMTLSSIGLLED